MKAQRHRSRRQSKADRSLRKARAALAVGEEIRAIKHLGRAIEHNPSSVPAYRALAGLLAGRGELRRAQGLLMRAVEIDPGCAEAQLMLGVMLRRRGRHDAALQPLICATNAMPNDAVAWRELGEALLLHGDLEEAYEAFERVSTLEPGSAGPVGQAAVAERRGDLEAALACLQPWTDDPFALCVWGRILRRLGRSSEALPLVARALESNTHPQVRERLGHVFGELLEAVGEYDAALGAHRMANESRLTRYVPEEHTARIDAIMSRFNALPPVAVSLGAPPVVVIVGMPRSGTSLTETILSRHPDVFAGGELQALGDHASCLSLNPSRRDWAKAGDAYLGSVSQAAGSLQGTVTDKLPDNYLHLGFLARMVPSARVVWCRRNAEDTCVSAFFQDFGVRLPYSQRLDWLGHRHREHERLMEHWKTVLPLPIHELHYEKLAREPESEIRALLEFCSLPFDAKCLSPQDSGRVVATASYAQVREPVHTRSIGRAQKFRACTQPLRDALKG